MKGRILLMLALCCCTVQASFGQNKPSGWCKTDSLHAAMMQDPAYAKQYRARVQAVDEYVARKQEARGACEETYVIPVAVHFQDGNIDMGCAVDMALDQVAILNADYSANNDDISNWNQLQPEIWPDIQNAGACIQFCLATLNHPDGSGLQDGDYAVTIGQTTGDSDPAWSGYLNYWVRQLSGGTLGYSPLGGAGDGDGIAVDIHSFSSISCGGNTVDPPFDLGRTMSHETGHYLLLQHPWAGGGCNSDDMVDDTPVTDAATYGCPDDETINCTEPILWPTYMEYCDDQCLFMFSEGQVERMEGYVSTTLQNLTENAVTQCQEYACEDFSVNLDTQMESCGGNDGLIDVSVTGGTEPYQYSTNGGATYQTSGTYDSLMANTYPVKVRDANGCEFVDTLTLESQTPVIEVASSQPAFCGDSTGALQVSVPGNYSFEYKIQGVTSWQDSAQFNGLPAGNYQVQVRNETFCSATEEVEVGNQSDLNPRIRRLQPVNCPYYDNGEVNISTRNGVNVEYTLTSGILPEEMITTTGEYTSLSPGQYHVNITDDRGCQEDLDFAIRRSFVNIDEDCPCRLFVPNAITTDENGINDLFRVEASCPLSSFELQIIDRWGKEIFRTNDIDKAWNGGLGGPGSVYATPGIYMYVIRYKWGTQLSEDIQVHTKTGHVTVIR